MDEIEKLSINISPFSQPAEYRLYRRDNAVLTLTLTLQGTDALTSPLLPAFSHPLTRIFGQNRSQ